MSPEDKKRIYYTANWTEYKWTTDWNCQCSSSSTWVLIYKQYDDGTLWMPLKCSFKQNKKTQLRFTRLYATFHNTLKQELCIFLYSFFLRSSTRRWRPSLPAQIADDAENYDLLSRKQNKRATRNRVRHLGLEFKIQHDYIWSLFLSLSTMLTGFYIITHFYPDSKQRKTNVFF